jgi:hypothetical protein
VTAQLPVAVLRGDDAAHLPRVTFFEGQGSPQLDIDDFQRPRVGPPEARRRQRHFEDRGCRQHRNAFNGMVAKPRQELGIEVIEPKRHRALLPETEERMIEDRVDEIGVLDRALKPEPVAIPHVKRQTARIDGPIEAGSARDVMAGYMAFGGNCRKRILIRLFAGQCCQYAPLPFDRPQRIVEIRLQHRVWADLDEDPVSGLDQHGGRIGKADRITDIAPPVIGVENPGRDRRGGDRRDQAVSRGLRPQTGKLAEEIVADRVHRRRVEGKIEIKGAKRDAASAGFPAKRVDRLAWARNGDRMPRVDRAYLQRTTDLGQQFVGIGAAQRQCRHASRTARALLVAAARGDDPRRIRQGERPRGPRGGDFADAVADMSRCFDSQLSQNRRDADLDREQQRLSDVGSGEALGIHAPLDQLGDRPAQRWPKRDIRLRDGRPERLAATIDITPHPRPLRAIAGEHEGELALAHGGSGDNRGIGRVGDKLAERGDGLSHVLARSDETLGVVIPPARRRPQQPRCTLRRSSGEGIVPTLR